MIAGWPAHKETTSGSFIVFELERGGAPRAGAPKAP